MIINGGISVRRHFVSKEQETTSPERRTSLIARHSFRPIDVEREEKEAYGWVNPFDLVKGSIAYEDLSVGNDVIVFGARRDKKTISPAIFKARVRERIEEVKKEKGLERLTRMHRLSISEAISSQMLKETSPTTTLSDAAWTGDLLLVGSTGAASERVSETFASTFNVIVQPGFPGVIVYRDRALAEKIGMSNASAMEMVDALSDYGTDFLSWLLVKSLLVELPINVSVVDTVTFVSNENKKEKVKITGEDLSDNKEVFRHLRAKNRVCSARFEFTSGGDSWVGTVDRNLDVKGLKLPVPKIIEEHELAEMRVGSIAQFFEVLDELFAKFLTVRTSEVDWMNEVLSWRALDDGGDDGDDGGVGKLDVKVTFARTGEGLPAADETEDPRETDAPERP